MSDVKQMPHIASIVDTPECYPRVILNHRTLSRLGMINAAQLHGALIHAHSEGGLGIGSGTSDDAAIVQIKAGAMPGILDDLPFFERSFVERPTQIGGNERGQVASRRNSDTRTTPATQS